MPKRKNKKKLGQAPALTARDWQRWVRFVLEYHTTQMAALIQFTGLFALRCGEACNLSGRSEAASFSTSDSDPQKPGLGQEPWYDSDNCREGSLHTRATRSWHQLEAKKEESVWIMGSRRQVHTSRPRCIISESQKQQEEEELADHVPRSVVGNQRPEQEV